MVANWGFTSNWTGGKVSSTAKCYPQHIVYVCIVQSIFLALYILKNLKLLTDSISLQNVIQLLCSSTWTFFAANLINVSNLLRTML